MDAQGILPKALERACQLHKAKVIYLMPTMHNPTTATMSPQRRTRIAAIIRKHGLTLIEDDPYAFLTSGITPLTALAPERSYLAASLSKCIAPGFRTSLLVAPDASAAARLTGLLRATVQMSVPLIAAIITRWMRDGDASAIIAAISAEASARQSLARDVLAGHAYAAHPNGHHIWLPLPAGWSNLRFAAHLQRRGLAVVTGEAFATTAAPPSSIRIALGAARSQPLLLKALEILKEALNSQAREEQVV
jgi:DNA-binding transcriptional MocR family regulator